MTVHTGNAIPGQLALTPSTLTRYASILQASQELKIANG